MIVTKEEARRSALERITSVAVPEAEEHCRGYQDYDDFLRDLPLYHAINSFLREREPWQMAQIDEAMRDVKLNKHAHNWFDVYEQLVNRPALAKDNSWHTPVRVAYAILKKELNAAVQRRYGGKLAMLPMETVDDLDVLWEVKNTSAGVIALGKKKYQVQEEALLVAQELKRRIEEGTPVFLPFVSLQRTQVSNVGTIETGYSHDPKRKFRPVECEDAATNIIDAAIMVPVYRTIKHEWWEYSGGDSPKEQRYKMTKYQGLYVPTSTDYSKFDQSLPPWLLGLAFKAIKSIFREEDAVYIDYLEQAYAHREVITPFGRVHVDGGLASGVKGTQIIGSMVNFIMRVSYAASFFVKKGRSFGDVLTRTWERISDGNHVRLQVMGDDSVDWFELGDPEGMSDFMWRTYRIVVKPEKSFVGESREAAAKYLKRTWTRRGCYRDPIDLFVKLLCEEYWRDYDGRYHKDKDGNPITYSPWHILLGAYLTFPLSFPSDINEHFFLKKLKKRGGVSKLVNVDWRNLPGFWRGMGPTYGAEMLDLLQRYENTED